MADDEEGKDAMSLWGHTGYGEADEAFAIPLRNIPIRLLNNIQVRKENQ